MQRTLSQKQIKTFQAYVLSYYKKHGRTLPWRKTKDPYKILVSEIMLQQTQVVRVLDKYSQFIKRFPTLRALAGASFKDIMELWQGLGYNRRALALKRVATTIVKEKEGKVPQELSELVNLPGIGEATASCILAFAFNKPVIFIETNIRSVFIYHFFKQRKNISDKALLRVIEQTLLRDNVRVWYWALMDYGVYLKEKYDNPSRQSAHYKKQSRFSGSHRELRGKIIALLTKRGRIAQGALTKKLAQSPSKVAKGVRELLKEGLIVEKGKYFLLP